MDITKQCQLRQLEFVSFSTIYSFIYIMLLSTPPYIYFFTLSSLCNRKTTRPKEKTSKLQPQKLNYKKHTDRRLLLGSSSNSSTSLDVDGLTFTGDNDSFTLLPPQLSLLLYWSWPILPLLVLLLLFNLLFDTLPPLSS